MGFAQVLRKIYFSINLEMWNKKYNFTPDKQLLINVL